MQALGDVFIAGLAAYLVYGRPSNAAEVGFALNMAGKDIPRHH